jgi:hypothetical protein
LLKSFCIIAEETYCKHKVTESQLNFLEKDLQEQRGHWEEQIISCDLSKLDDMLKCFYELKKKHILQALERDIDIDQEGG